MNYPQSNSESIQSFYVHECFCKSFKFANIEHILWRRKGIGYLPQYRGVESVGFSWKVVFHVVNIPASGYSIYRMDDEFLTHGGFRLLWLLSTAPCHSSSTRMLPTCHLFLACNSFQKGWPLLFSTQDKKLHGLYVPTSAPISPT